MKLKTVSTFFLLLVAISLFSQEEEKRSNIQTYTPSVLLSNSQLDIKWFNNLYTENKFANSNGDSQSKSRENYFTSTLEVFTGISENKRINIGAIIEYRSNTNGGKNAFSVFDSGQRSGITSIAPAIKFQPLESVGNFSIQSALHIPLTDKEVENGVFLDQTAWTFQNRFFYDYTFGNGNWQVFTELNTEYHFENKNSFANNTFSLTPGVFLSYFANSEWTVLGFTQHFQRFGDFTQDYTSLGLGSKYQLNSVLNLEVLYSNFVRGTDNGLGQSFNIGLRALF